MTVIEAIKVRSSCRTYSNKPIEPHQFAVLYNFLEANKEAPFGSKVRFRLLDLNELESGELKNLGTYGVIKGARHFVVGAIVKAPWAMEDYGYCMEKNILEATALGLGTCLLGGTFKRSGFAGKINTTKDELLPVISPVGYSSGKRSILDRTFRLVAGSNKRKPWPELFYVQDTDTPLNEGNAGKYNIPLECVRIAPSASNKQPWRIVKDRERDNFHFYLRRTPGYEKYFKDIKLQNVDMGIAMCHFELSAKELGLNGKWHVKDPCLKSPGLEYIASWVAHA